MSAGLQTTQPLALGIQLEAGSSSMVAGAFSVPITMKDATLAASSSSADVGIGWPLLLGLSLGTSGTTNYTLTAGATSLPITMKGATLSGSFDTADVQIFPLSLGLLLASQNISLVAGAFNVPIVFADGVPSEFTDNVGGGIYEATKKRFIGDAAMMVNGQLVKTIPSPKVKAPQGFTEEEMLLLL